MLILPDECLMNTQTKEHIKIPSVGKQPDCRNSDHSADQKHFFLNVSRFYTKKVNLSILMLVLKKEVLYKLSNPILIET